MENGLIEDDNIRASSMRDSRPSAPSRARLNHPYVGGGIGAWKAEVNDAHQWIEAKLNDISNVSGNLKKNLKKMVASPVLSRAVPRTLHSVH